ncbi:MAG: hypothetical protein QOE48_367 [Mycobacterium sp.]|jgi:hypothetical protein|nr:hypothetical protein [Mycobacterium sp.]
MKRLLDGDAAGVLLRPVIYSPDEEWEPFTHVPKDELKFGVAIKQARSHEAQRLQGCLGPK